MLSVAGAPAVGCSALLACVLWLIVIYCGYRALVCFGGFLIMTEYLVNLKNGHKDKNGGEPKYPTREPTEFECLIYEPVCELKKLRCLLLKFCGCFGRKCILAMLMLKKCARNIKSVRMSKNELFKLIITHPAKIKWGHKRKQANVPSSPTAGGKGGGAHRDNQKTTDAERSGTPAVAVQRFVRRLFHDDDLTGHLVGFGVFCILTLLFFYCLPFHNFLVNFFYAIFDRLSYVGGIY
jgi:hypothetical protein